MARKGTIAKWDSLSPKYKARLARNGYTLEDYLEGRSRKAARGHAHTPEKPSRVIGHETEYREWILRTANRISPDRRRRLFDKIDTIVRTDRSVGRWDVSEIREHIDHMNTAAFLEAERIDFNKWRELGRVAAGRMSDDERDAILADWEYSYYDESSGHYVNPFWYH